MPVSCFHLAAEICDEENTKLLGSDSNLFLTVLPSLLRNPGVFPPSAEGHHWVCRAEDWCVPEPQRSGQCHSLLPPYRTGFGKAKPPHQHRTRNFQLKSRSASGFSSTRVWEMFPSSFSWCQGPSGAVLLESLGMPMGMVCLGTGQISGMAESEYCKIQISFLDPKLPLVCPA